MNHWAGLPRLFLGVGEIACPPDPYWVTTILGSCVSLCLWDPVRKAGGINHAVLPRGGAGGRYGQTANAQLLEAMLEGGSERQDLRAKLFGGAAAIGTVGAQNVVAALEYLEAQRVPLLARRTGGNQGVLLHYRTDTGEVRLRRG